MPGAGGRKIIYLQPLGEFPDTAPNIETLRKYMEAYFHPMEVEVTPNLGIAKNGSVKSRTNGGQLQWNYTDILDQLQIAPSPLFFLQCVQHGSINFRLSE